MKKQIFKLVLAIFSLNFSYSQNVIKMQRINGIYHVPCKVNGIPMNFVFDTGAADVTISITEAKFLIKQGLISKEDFIGNTNYQIASGDEIVGTKIYLKTIEIDGIILRNIPASIIHQQNAPLLLGQSAIEKIGKYTIDGDKLILNDFEITTTEVIDSKNVCFYDNVTLMFTTKETNIYKSKNIKSEILRITPVKSEVIILDEDFKSSGWMKICFEGIDGWVKKETLSYEMPEE
jgi:clan AA aspartic protease (TIGR02281 family)